MLYEYFKFFVQQVDDALNDTVAQFISVDAVEKVKMINAGKDVKKKKRVNQQNESIEWPQMIHFLQWLKLLSQQRSNQLCRIPKGAMSILKGIMSQEFCRFLLRL